MIILLILGLFLALIAFTNYLKNWNHILLILLTLEIFMLANSTLIAVLVSSHLLAPESLFLFFTLAVREASLGIGILIHYTRYFGKDFLTTANI